MRISLAGSLGLAASLTVLAGCGASVSHQASPPQYKVWSVSKNAWQTTPFVDKNGAVVIAMASWCKYCAWEAKWEEPQLLRWGREHHIRVVLVDISPRGGIGIAGPQNNASAGTDGSGQFLGSGAHGLKVLEATLKRYAATYHLPLAALTIDPADTTVFAKKAQEMPAIFLVSPGGRITRTFQGTTPASSIESAFAAP